MKKSGRFFTIFAVCCLLSYTTPSNARECDAPSPDSVSYSAAPGYESFVGAYTGFLEGRTLCVTIYLERIDSEGKIKGQYAVGDWLNWNIRRNILFYSGTIDKVTGKGVIHPDGWRSDRSIIFFSKRKRRHDGLSVQVKYQAYPRRPCQTGTATGSQSVQLIVAPRARIQDLCRSSRRSNGPSDGASG